ncbi:hypothetical protein D3C76_511200 [compost metagenome]
MVVKAFSTVSLDAAKWDAGVIDTCFLSPIILPVKTSNSLIFSISSPKNSTLIPLLDDDAGIMSKESPLTLNVPLAKSISFLSY